MAILLSAKPFWIPGTCILFKNPCRVVDLSHPAFILVLYFVFCDVKREGGGGAQLRCVSSPRKIDFPSYTTLCHTQGPLTNAACSYFIYRNARNSFRICFCWRDGVRKGRKLGYRRLGFQTLTMLQGAALLCLTGSLLEEYTLLPSCEVGTIIVCIV